MESIRTASVLEPVSPARPVAPYVGGKRHLARQITQLIATVPHQLYAEPFLGLGGIFLRRTHRPKIEVVNDLSGDIVILFRILQRHYQSFMEELKWRFSSRAEFERLMATNPDTLTDLERAARFLYLQRAAFGGKVMGRNFAMAKHGPARFDITKLAPMLEDVHERLAGVTIERLPYAEFIRQYDGPGTLFYLDPPYWGTEGYYGPTFSRADFEALRAALEASQGRFILSINDTPEIRHIFAAFEQREVEATYRLSGAPTAARELLILQL